MRRLAAIVGVLVFALALRPADSLGQSPSELLPQDGVLLLGNGEVISGRITRAGDQFFVALAEGEIRVRALDVEFFCATVDEGYQRKRAAINPHNVGEVLKLAQWCIQHRLYGYAAHELSEAYRLEPRHPQIAAVERKLTSAMAKPPVTSGSSSGAKGPTPVELDALARRLPAASIETFTHTIQPMLQNHCANAGCHNVGSSDTFALERTPQGRPPSRRFTLRNLHTILEHVDSANFASSPLLTTPLDKHGGGAKAVFVDPASPQYRQLVAWVKGLAPPVEKPVAKTEPPPVVTPANHQEPIDASPPQETPTPTTAPHPSSTKPPDDYTPVDPFDAEVFNRKHFKDSGR